MKILVLNPSSQTTKNVIRDVLYGCWCKGRRIGGATIPPHSALSLATYLVHAGMDTDFIDAAHELKTREDIKGVINKYDFLVASTSSMSFAEDVDFFRHLKGANKHLKMIIFGSHPTFLPEDTLLHGGVDIIIKGEPEYATRNIIESISNNDDSWKKLRGVGFKTDRNTLGINPGNEFIEDLDELPYMNINLLPKGLNYFNPIVRRMPYMTMVTSRGCPGKCNFCTAPFFYGSKIRFQSPMRVINEVRHLKDSGYKEIYFRDETFTADYKRVEEICNIIISEKIDITWLCNARSGTVDENLANLMKKAGCHMVKIGVESGVQEILDKSNKGITVGETTQTVSCLKKAGINVHAHVMLGMPGDTAKTVDETIKFVCEIDPYTASFGICTPYPGTPLFYMVKEKLAKTEKNINLDSLLNLKTLHTTAVYNELFTDLKRDELERSVRQAYRKFYMTPRAFFKYTKDFQNIKKSIKAGGEILAFMVRGDE